MKSEDTPMQDQSLESRSKALFDASVHDLDTHVRSRLRQARQAASAQMPRRSRPVWLVPALTSVAAAMLVALVLPRFERQQPLTESFAATDDMTLLMNVENLELIEDIEFYAWLDDAPDAFDNAVETSRGDS